MSGQNSEGFFENKTEKSVFSIKELEEKMSDRVGDLQKNLDSMKTHGKKLYLLSENLENLPLKLEEKFSHSFYEATQKMSKSLESKIDQGILNASKEIQSLVDQSEKLIRKNRWALAKRQWLMTGVFSLGCLVLSLSLIYFIPVERITKELTMKDSLVHLNGAVLAYEWDNIPDSVKKTLKNSGARSPKEIKSFVSVFGMGV